MQEKRPEAGVVREVKSKANLLKEGMCLSSVSSAIEQLHAGLMPVWLTVQCVSMCVPHSAVEDVFVYMSEHMPLMIAAHSYFLKHNSAGAVIIFGLEWLINF